MVLSNADTTKGQRGYVDTLSALFSRAFSAIGFEETLFERITLLAVKTDRNEISDSDAALRASRATKPHCAVG